MIPARLRRLFRIDEGSTVAIEERSDGVLIRPAVVLPLEMYSPVRKAELLLSNAVDTDDYARAREEAHKLGIDPDTVPHRAPEGA